MKTKLFLFFAIGYSIISNAQLSAVDYKSKDYIQFKASKTYVVLSGNKKYDTEIKAVMADVWKVTPFSFIGVGELEVRLPEKDASFITLMTIETSNAGQSYHYLGLINGGKKKLSKYKYDDLLAYCPLNFYQNESSLSECHFRLRNMIQSMVLSMDIVQANDIKGSSAGIVKGLREIYNSKAPKIKERTLLFCDETVGKLSEKEIAAICPFKFEICKKEKIAKAIKDKSTEYYYFQPGITLNKSMFVFDPSNGEVVYFDYNMMGLNINKGNIEDLAKAVNPKKK